MESREERRERDIWRREQVLRESKDKMGGERIGGERMKGRED